MPRCKLISLLLLLSLTVLTTCRTTTGSYRAVTLVTDDRNTTERFESITDSYKAWETFTVKGRFTVAGNENAASASMQMRMARGRYIYISLRGGMGIEGGKIFITGDSLHIVDKLNRCYIADDITAFTAGIPVSVDALQDVMLCRAFGTDEAEISEALAGSFTATCTDNGIYSRTFMFNRYNLLDLTSLSADNGRTTCHVGYADYVDTDRGIVATSVAIVSALQGSPVTMQATFTPASIVWDNPIDDKLTIPASYTRVDIHTLLQQLENEK